MRYSSFFLTGMLILALAACSPTQPASPAPVVSATATGSPTAPAAQPATRPASPGPSAGAPTQTPLLVSSATPLFSPPTPTGQASAPAADAPEPAAAGPGEPTPTLDCQNGLRYLSDLTIPDGAQVTPGEQIDKRWQVENSGGCNWDERYRLRRISGDTLGAQGEQPLYPARSGTQAVIRLLLIAPTEPGTYRSVWQAIDPQGQPFGDPVTIEILVANSTP